jgi:hypothetical protein
MVRAGPVRGFVVDTLERERDRAPSNPPASLSRDEVEPAVRASKADGLRVRSPVVDTGVTGGAGRVGVPDQVAELVAVHEVTVQRHHAGAARVAVASGPATETAGPAYAARAAWVGSEEPVPHGAPDSCAAPEQNATAARGPALCRARGFMLQAPRRRRRSTRGRSRPWQVRDVAGIGGSSATRRRVGRRLGHAPGGAGARRGAPAGARSALVDRSLPPPRAGSRRGRRNRGRGIGWSPSRP